MVRRGQPAEAQRRAEEGREMTGVGCSQRMPTKALERGLVLWLHMGPGDTLPGFESQLVH